jgi:hypothetical protein
MPQAPSAPQPTNNLTYNELRQKCDSLEREVERLRGLCDHQHAIILGQQPTMAHLHWESMKWQHYKRILETNEGKSAAAEAESMVQQRMAGLI